MWVIDPEGDTIADDIAAWIGKGDWVIVHIHWQNGNSSTVIDNTDLRLVQKGTG